MWADTGVAARTGPLLNDVRRVLSTPGELFCRMSSFVDASRHRTNWGEADRVRLFTVANLVAYHVARSGGAPLADRVLRAEVNCLVQLSKTSRCGSVADLGLDPVLNRIRLAALTGDVDGALCAIDDCLGGSAHRARDDEHSLLHGVQLFAGLNRDRLHDLLRNEKLLIAWRSGRLSVMDGESARRFVVRYGGRSPQLVAEVELRLRLTGVAPPAYFLAPGDTLKRALHRALVYVDQLAPPPDDLLCSVINRGLERLGEMSFVCPSTPHLWARTALRWFESCAVDQVSVAERAARRARTRILEAVARSLDAIVGAAPPPVDVTGETLGSEYANHVITFLERASNASPEVAGNGR